MHRFFVSPASIDFPNRLVHFSAEQAHQFLHVLRLQPGDAVIVLDNTGKEYLTRLQTITIHNTTATILNTMDCPGEPRARLLLYTALTRREKFEWILQKGTEVGVSEFIPVITARTLARDKTTEPNRTERWQRILQEAAEQSHRGRIPVLHSTLSLTEALTHAARQTSSLLIPWEGEAQTTLHTYFEQQAEQPTQKSPPCIALFIGPEGGYAEEEICIARQAGAHPITLGKRILRMETAAIVAAALVLYKLDEPTGNG